jgi:hypothetical protein
MSGATLTFGVTELAMDKVAEAKTHAPGVVAFFMRVLGGFLASWVEKRARHLAELAVWFNGAVVTLAQERVNAPLDLNDELVPAIERTEQSLLEMRAVVLGLIAEFTANAPDSRAVSALRALAHSAADLHEAASHFKWALMENDADVDISHGNFEVFGDAESLLESLKH